MCNLFSFSPTFNIRAFEINEINEKHCSEKTSVGRQFDLLQLRIINEEKLAAVHTAQTGLAASRMTGTCLSSRWKIDDVVSQF